MAPARSRLSAHANRPSRVPTELPDYQPPTHPLNLTAQQAIRDLPRTHKLDSLKSRLKAANLHLTDAAAEINDRFQEKNVQNERRKARRAAVMSSQESSEEADRELEEMQRATGMMTGDLERGVGKVIDAGEELKAVEQALQELNANVTAGRSAMTQSTLGASQFGQHQSIDNDDENEFVDRAASKGAADILKEKVEQHRAAYADFTMTERYASHNDYVGFKKMVHDAHYPAEEAPPMPHASTWFGEGAGTQTSSSNGPQGTQLDEDDDLVMASERISVKCPITLTEMRDPVSSTKCPHNFERQAFQEMLNNSELRVDGDGRRRTGTKAMRCPVAGCDMILKASDVRTDAVLVRKIKRAQAALNAHNEPEYDDEGPLAYSQKRGKAGYHDEEINSSSPAAPSQASRRMTARLKAERMSQAPNPREVSMVPNTQVGGEDDEDDGEEDEDL